MVNISFLQTWMQLLVHRTLLKNIWYLFLDIDSKANQGKSKKEKSVQPKRKIQVG